jgi:predicted dehydrogenase
MGTLQTRPERRIRVGVIGCGEAAQIIHLPTLSQLADRFEVTALCDISRTVLDGVGDRWGIETRLSDYRELAALPDVDAVVICNPDPYHADAAITAMEHGKDVLVEKPMTLGPRECDEVVATAERTGAIVQVGYMRRHADAMSEARHLLTEVGDIRLARVHDLIGFNHIIIDGTSNVIRGDDVPAEAIEETGRLRTALVEEALGPLPPELRRAYDLLLGLGSHDISAMRELLGTPRGVLHATARQNGDYVTATIDYGDYVCQFETGVDEIPRFDAHIEVFGARHKLRLQYDTPYVRNLPITLTVLEANGRGGTEERVIHPQWGDAFANEWRAFADSVATRTQPSASAADFRHDLELFADMVELMAAALDPAG